MPDAPPSLPRPNWFIRNWKWAAPGGCLVLFLLTLAFAGGVFFLVAGMMKQSDAYKVALARAKENPEVIEALGTPISEGLLISGSTHVSGAGGDANMAIPIRGPKGKGTIYVVAIKVANEWRFTTLEVEIDATQQRIRLDERATR